MNDTEQDVVFVVTDANGAEYGASIIRSEADDEALRYNTPIVEANRTIPGSNMRVVRSVDPTLYRALSDRRAAGGTAHTFYDEN